MDADRRPLTPTAPTPNLPPRALPVALGVVPAVFLAVFFVWPLATLLGRLLGADAVADALSRPGLGRIVWFTVWQAVVSTVLTVVVGLGPAFLVARCEFRGRRALRALITVPFLLPTVVVGAAFAALLPATMVGTPAAVVAAHVFFNVAVVVRVVGALWAQLPPDLAAAARTLGASAPRALWHVTLPLLRPALVAAAVVTFLFTFTSYGVVRILGGPANPTLEVEVARRALQAGDASGAAVLSVIQLVFLVVVIVAAARLSRSARVRLPVAPVRRTRATTGRLRILVIVGALVTAAATAAPLVALALSSVRVGGGWSLVAWRELGAREIRPGISLGIDATASILRSLRVALAATVVSVTLGTLAALGVAAARRHGRLLDAALMLPLGTSAVTLGLAMLVTFDAAPVEWRDEPWIVPLGHALIGVPFVVRTVLPVVAARPQGWVDAAATLGATPLRAWWAIDVAIARRPVAVATAFAAAISLGEFGATSFLSRSGGETMPLAIARLLARTGDLPRAQAFVLATILAVVTGLLIVAVDAADGDTAVARAGRG